MNTNTAAASVVVTTAATVEVFDDPSCAACALPASDQLACVEHALQARTEGVVLSWSNTLGEQHAFSAAELDRWVAKTANFLAARGVVAGSTVLAALLNHYQLWMLALAARRLGAEVAALSESADEAEVARALRETGASAVVCTNHGSVADVVDHVVYLCCEMPVRLMVNGDGAPAHFLALDERDEGVRQLMCHEDGLPHGAELSGAFGVCALGCMRTGWVDFNTGVRVTRATDPQVDARAGATARLAGVAA